MLVQNISKIFTRKIIFKNYLGQSVYQLYICGLQQGVQLVDHHRYREYKDDKRHGKEIFVEDGICDSVQMWINNERIWWTSNGVKYFDLQKQPNIKILFSYNILLPCIMFGIIYTFIKL